MFKKRYFSVYKDFKTSLLSKLLFIIGGFLLGVFLFLKISSMVISSESTGFIGDLYTLSCSTLPDTILAFSIIFIAIGFIFYFFYRQFVKLAKIADEIENSEEIEADEEKT